MTTALDEHGDSVIRPFLSINEVLQWIPHSFSCGSVVHGDKLAARLLNSREQDKARKVTSRPQVLVCHDMLGGYLEDKFSHGTPSSSTAYRFCHWKLIDIFVYFSHNFVTIPPVGWIMSAHRHGVIVLGTIITEWDEGTEVCKEILKSEESIDQFTTKLAQLALFYGFDGWLVNIENKIEIDLVPKLQKFVEQLTNKCHCLLEESKVIWYDSVISTGELKWQDELNSLNEMFFKVADGMFLNYCITEEKLSNSKCLSSATGRELDLFVGIDVFGRLTPDGGGFNTRETLKRIMDHGLSCALFAPGWVLECLGPQQFDSNQLMFWGILGEILAPRHVEVPFATSFCQGYGQRYYLQGKVLAESPWYNMSLQQLQPNFTQSQFMTYTVSKTVEPLDPETLSQQEKPKEKFRIEAESHKSHPAGPEMMFDLSDGYFGGGSLRITAKNVESQPVIFRLFVLKIQPGDTVLVTVTFKMPIDSSCHFGLVMSECKTRDQLYAGSSVVCTQDELDSKCKEVIQMELQKLGRCFLMEDCTNVHFVADARSEQNMQNVEGEWMTCVFSIDTDHLMKESCASQNCTLSVILIPLVEPSNGGDPAGLMCAHIGYLQVLESSDGVPAARHPSVKNLKCLEVKVNSVLSEVDIQQIIHHPCFGLDERHLENLGEAQEMKEITGVKFGDVETKGMLNSLGKNTVSKHELDLRSPTPTTSVSLLEAGYSLYVLKWEVLRDNVDSCLVYCWDESDTRSFIGHSVKDWFVWKQPPEGKKVIRFSIQPIMSLLSLTAEEVCFCL